MIKKIYYTLLDLATLRKGIPVVINNFKVRLPARYYKYFAKNYEEENFRFFEKHCKPGMTTLDIGAHFGLLSVFFQKITNGAVYAFEPTLETLKVLRETVAINHCTDKVHIIDKAVDAAPGTATFFVQTAIGGRGNTLVKDSTIGMTTSSYEVQVTSVDQFVKEKSLSVDCLKIDAEGVELGVLKGAADTISKYRPLILLSIHPEPIKGRGDSLEEIWDFIQQFHYNVFVDETPMSKVDFCSAVNLFDVHLTPGKPEC